MKKNFIGILLVALMLSACSSNDEVENGKSSETKTEEVDGAVGVDKGLFNVEITIPASFFERMRVGLQNR